MWAVDAVPLVIVREIGGFALQVTFVPEKRSVLAFTAKSTDEVFDEGMGKRDVEHGLDLCDLAYL